MKNSVVLVTQVFAPDPTSTSILFSPLIHKYAFDTKDEVEIFCGYPVSGAFKDLKRYEEINNVRVRRFGLKIEAKRNLLWRAASYVGFLVHVFYGLIKLKKGSKVVCVTNPPFLFWFVAIASRLKGFKFAHIVLDMYPEGWIALGRLSSRNLLARLWVSLNAFAYRSATLVCVLGRDMIPLLRKNYKISKHKFRYIPHWSAIDGSKKVSGRDDEFNDKFAARNKFVVQYSGNMGIWHDIDTFVKAAAMLKDHNNILFLFIGGGVRLSKAMELARKTNVTNIYWHDFVPLGELEKSLSVASVALISLRKGLSGVAVPCKLYGILASGRPVIAQVPSDSEVAFTIDQHDCGVIVKPGHVDDLVKSIVSLSSDPDAVERMSLNSLTAYNNYYDLNSASITFANIINDL